MAVKTYLPCPECRAAGRRTKIGNTPSRCATCNRYNQRVYRIAMRRLREAHREEWERLRDQAEADAYRQTIERWAA